MRSPNKENTMANRTFNTQDNNLYWKDEEVLRRFKALQKDFKASFIVKIMELNNALLKKEITEEEHQAYTEGYEHACKDMASSLEDRFAEITRRI